MANPTLIAPKLEVRTFKRREHLPLRENFLWQIEAGAVRSYTLTEDGTVIALGFWGLGDTVGQPLACIQPYEIECLTDVMVHALQFDQCSHLNQVLLSHLHQTQTLLRLRSGQIHQRLQQLLDWLADKFGHELEQGQLIQLRLTHQDIADVLGTTRVTVTRLLSQFEQEGRICWMKQNLFLPRSL
ncbi:Crp/Fnr family transcriptional regulator [Pantanalinema rosaneae CENA516]|uniref:Crp/Fnr family transcriptional regulator n=1 Tax=Pantanalinema rosaneae TaxID=1620701 RepID=UPI003D6E9463